VGEAREHIGKRHHRQVVVAHVTDLVRQHPSELPQRQPPEQPFGEADHRPVRRAGGEGVERHAGDHVGGRNGRQLGATGELLDNVGYLAAVARVDGAGAVHAHDDLRRQARRERPQDRDRQQGHQNAGP